MTITGDVSKLELNTIVFKDLKGVESKCAQSLEPFEENDQVIVISQGIVKDGSIELNDGVYFVKHGAALDFLTRFVENMYKDVVKSS